MPILTKEVEIKLWGSTVKYYNDLGYAGNHGDIVTVKINDLPNSSKANIEILCDLCKENKMIVKYDTYNRVIKNTGSYVCKECSHKKQSRTNQEKYGTPIVSKSNVIKEKIKQTNLARYGVDNYGKTKECHEKIKETCLEKYGVEHYAKLQEVKDKRVKTNLERYGVENASSFLKTKEKLKQTNLQKYGVPYTLQSVEVREKICQTLYKNGTQKTSKQQLYLYSLYGGELNYPIKYYDVDICFPNEKIYLEYDGGGHDLRVTLGRLTKEEFNQKEIIRNNVLKKEGYKRIKIVSKLDLLPSDQILLQMLQEARNYFSQYPNHSWYEFNISTSTIRNAEHKDGIPYDFGTLRTIKDSDLDNIENDNLNNVV